MDCDHRNQKSTGKGEDPYSNSCLGYGNWRRVHRGDDGASGSTVPLCDVLHPFDGLLSPLNDRSCEDSSGEGQP